jgi:putative glutathione S-transferase
MRQPTSGRRRTITVTVGRRRSGEGTIPMGRFINGQWSTEQPVDDHKGRFIRAKTQYHHWVSEAGAPGFAAEPGRYHLYVSYACPWAHRTLITRKLRGLEQVVSLSIVDPVMGSDGWHFSHAPGCIPDRVNGARFLREIYLKANTHYSGHVTVPVLWDRRQETIVNNESREIMRMFDTVFNGSSSANFCPAELRERIDETIDALYEPINNGVYRAGFAGTQDAYEEAVTELFIALDGWERHLAERRYLCGKTLTEADFCFFTTLVRFDVVYHTHFKCDLRRIVDYPNIWNYLRDLYQVPGIADTCNFDHIKRHYFQSHTSLNPKRIVPLGPIIDFNAAHDRERFN